MIPNTYGAHDLAEPYRIYRWLLSFIDEINKYPIPLQRIQDEVIHSIRKNQSEFVLRHHVFHIYPGRWRDLKIRFFLS